MPLVKIEIIKGKSKEYKVGIMDGIHDLNYNCGIGGEDIIIVINEPYMCNWGIKGGISAEKIKFGFELSIE